MSKNNQVITISPPMFIGEGNQKESISSKGHRCSYCHGNGFFWGEEQRERVKVDCPVCKGSGKLDAVITIEWKPAKQNERWKKKYLKIYWRKLESCSG